MSKLRILYATTEINPFLQTTQVAEFLRMLPQGMQERGMEIRIFVPRFGLINERKNRLHEVVRDRKSTRLNSSHANISYAVFCLKKKKNNSQIQYICEKT